MFPSRFRCFLPSCVLALLLVVTGQAWAQAPADASFVRFEKLEARVVGERQEYLGVVQNRLDSPVSGLTVAVRFIRQVDVPVVKFVELDARPSSQGTAEFTVVPSLVAPEIEPSTLVGVSVTIASYAVAPELPVLRKMVREGTDLDVLAAVRSAGLDVREAASLVPDRLLFEVRDAAGEDEGEAGAVSGLWAALLGRLLVRAGHDEDLPRIAGLLADAERALPPDVVSRASSMAERAGVLSLVGNEGTLAGALGLELRRRPGVDPLARFLEGVGRRPVEEHAALLAIAATAFPTIDGAARVLGPRPGWPVILGPLASDTWLAGLWLALDLDGNDAAGQALAKFEPVDLLPWTIVQEGAMGARATARLAGRDAAIPEAVKATLTRDPKPMLELVGKRIREADRALVVELGRVAPVLARHGLDDALPFARFIGTALLDDPTMHSLAWPLVESFATLVKPDGPGTALALGFLAPKLVEATEPWSALQALVTLEGLAVSPEAKGHLARAYELLAGSTDEAVARAASKRREALGTVALPVAQASTGRGRMANWLLVIFGIVAAGAYAYWRRR